MTDEHGPDIPEPPEMEVMLVAHQGELRPEAVVRMLGPIGGYRCIYCGNPFTDNPKSFRFFAGGVGPYHEKCLEVVQKPIIGTSNPFFDAWKYLKSKGSRMEYGDVLYYAEIVQLGGPRDNPWHIKAMLAAANDPTNVSEIINSAIRVEANRRRAG